MGTLENNSVVNNRPDYVGQVHASDQGVYIAKNTDSKSSWVKLVENDTDTNTGMKMGIPNANNTNAIGTNQINAVRVIAPLSGTVSSIVFQNNANGAYTCKLAIYADSSRYPGALLGQTAEISVADADDYFQVKGDLITPVSITAGNHYWLAIHANDVSAVIYYCVSGGGGYYKAATYASGVPDPFPAGGTGTVQYHLMAF